MRDVDMFVGVASVGNDPNWSDGGPEGRYRDYWTSYSFGALSQTAKTRRQVLQRLIPRLKIADRCRLKDRFLIVQGNIRTYRIHLGSGNILMEPNDQYLCIVPTRAPTTGNLGTRLFLPFEGDRTLAIILSKAFLLAEDTKMLDLWQILSLSLDHLLEHRCCIWPATDEGIVQEGAEGKIHSSRQTGLHNYRTGCPRATPRSMRLPG
jgi:hypothetical protein